MVAESWAVDGVPLETVVQHVRRLDTDLMPPLRGSDAVHAFAPGGAHVPRVADSRTVTLGGWVIGPDTAGPGVEPAVEVEDRLAALRRMLRPPAGRQVELSRTWEDGDGVHTATALAIVPDPVDRVRVRGGLARFTVGFWLADPFFYGDPVTVTLSPGVPQSVTVGGDDNTTAIVLEAAGQLVNPRVTNSTPSPVVWVQLGTSVAVGDTVTVDVEDTTALRSSDGANLVGAVTHSGARAWFGLRRGANDVALSADGGAGTVDLTFRPVWY